MQNKNLPTASELRKKGVLLEGDRAIAFAQRLKGSPLTEAEKEVVLREGYSPVKYADDKGIPTIGFGQTGAAMKKDFFSVFNQKEKEITRYFPNYNKLDDNMKATLMGLYYRGDVKKDYNWVKEFNKGNYEAAATNLLDNDEYRKRLEAGGPDGVVDRFNSAFSNIMNYGQSKTKPVDVGTTQMSGNDMVSLGELLGKSGTGLENELLSRNDMWT